MRMDKAHWPRCLLWHGWLPMLSGVNGVSPWAADASESAGNLVEVALGQYSSGLITDWGLPDGFDADEVSARVPDAPRVWSDVCLVLDSVTAISAAGAGGTAGGAILIISHWIVCLILAGVLCLSLDLCRLCSELSCGRGGGHSCSSVFSCRSCGS